MRWTYQLERRFGHLAIPGLVRIVVLLNALVYLLTFQKPELIEILTLRPDRVLAGEVWRLVTFIFIPRYDADVGLNLLFMILYLNLLWFMGDGLERAWGSFKFNLFYLLGMIGTAVAVFYFHAEDATGWYLNSSILFAFATLFPNFPILLYFVFATPAKWVALFSLGGVLLEFGRGDDSARVAIVVSLANYLIFFGGEWVRIWREQGRTIARRQQFHLAARIEDDETLHHCKVCGSTEATSADLEFRVAADGEEYCLAHLPQREVRR